MYHIFFIHLPSMGTSAVSVSWRLQINITMNMGTWNKMPSGDSDVFCLTIETQAGGTNSSTSVRISVLSQGNCLGQSPVPCPQHTGSQLLSGENAKVVGKSDRHFCWLLMSRAAIRCDGAVSPPESPPESLRMSRPILAQPGPAPPCGVHSILLLGAKHPSSSF